MVGCQQSLKRSDLARSANYGVCVSHPMKYFGYQLVTLTTLEDVLLALDLDLVLANVEERPVAEECSRLSSTMTSLITKVYEGLVAARVKKTPSTSSVGCQAQEAEGSKAKSV